MVRVILKASTLTTFTFFSFDGCANTCLGSETPKSRTKNKTQKPIKTVTEPAPTTYRPVFITPSVSSGYDYSTPALDIQLVFDKPSTPDPSLPFLYEAPGRGKRDLRTTVKRENFN